MDLKNDNDILNVELDLSEKIDLKNNDDILNVELDPNLLSSYMENLSLEQLSLENIPDTSEFCDEISKNNVLSDSKNVSLLLEVNGKPTCGNFCEESENSTAKESLPAGKLCITKHDKVNNVDKLEIQKDFNGNENLSTVENLNTLIDKLELSDSENEEETEKSELRERGGPDRSRKRTSRSREQNTFGRRNYDRSQFNVQRLRFMSGASHIELNDSRPSSNISFYQFDSGMNFRENTNVLPGNSNSNLLYQNCGISTHSTAIQGETAFPGTGSSLYKSFVTSSDQSSSATQNRTVDQVYSTSFHNDFIEHSPSTSVIQNENIYPMFNYKDLFHEDSSTKCINSPESGYDTSTSPSRSPPLNFLAAPHLQLIPESFDEHEIFDFYINEVESFANCALDDSNFLSTSLDDEDNKKKEIIDYLKNTPVKQNEVFNATTNLVPISSSNLTNLSTENFIADPSESSSCVASNVNSGCVQTELNEIFELTSNVNEGHIQEGRNELSHVVPDVCKVIQTSLKESCPVASAVNRECLLAEESVSPFIPPSDTRIEYEPLMNSIDLKNTSNIKTTPVLSHCSQNNTGARIACRPLGDRAKKALRHILPKDDVHAAQAKIYRRINKDKKKGKIKVIYVEDEDDKASENQTNLHCAVLNCDVTEIYCLVEIHKQYNEDAFSDLNLRDKHRKTALDYAIQKKQTALDCDIKKLTLIIDYLRENNVCQSPLI